MTTVGTTFSSRDQKISGDLNFSGSAGAGAIPGAVAGYGGGGGGPGGQNAPSNQSIAYPGLFPGGGAGGAGPGYSGGGRRGRSLRGEVG